MLRVLVFASRTDARRSLVARIKKLGYEVHGAASVDRAVELLMNRDLDAVLVDRSSPGESASTPTAKLRAAAPGIRILSIINPPVDGTALDSGVLVRPVHTETLRVAIADAAEITTLQGRAGAIPKWAERTKNPEGMFTLIVEKSPASIVITDAEGRIEYVNEKFCSLTGYSFQEVIGRNPRILQSGKTPPAVYKKLWKTLSAKREWRGTFINRKKNGDLYYESAAIAPIRGRGGAVIGYLAVKEDITDRVEMERELRRTLAIVENSPVVIFRWRVAEGQPVEFVSNNIDQFGYSPSDLKSGKLSLSSIIDPDDLERVAGEMAHHARLGSDYFDREYRIVCANGETRWVDDRTVVERDETGRITHYQGIVLDITDRKTAQKMLQRTAHDLGERVKELNCLYAISRLAEGKDVSIEEIVDGAIRIILESWQYPEITCSRIGLEGREFVSENHRPIPWTQTAPITVAGKPIGMVEVGYLEERPESFEGPFTKEERNLIDEIGNRLGRIIELNRARDTLRKANETLEMQVGERTAELREAVRALKKEISQREKAEETALRAHAEIEQIFQTTAGGIRVLDGNFTVIRANAALAGMTGIPVDKMIGTKCWETFPENYCHDSAFCTLERIKRGETIKNREVLKRTRGGKEIVCLHNATPLRNEEGNIIGVLEDYRDLTEQRRLESIAEAVNAMDNLGYVFSGIRHEMGNPVNSIKMTLTVLKRKLGSFSTKAAEEYLDRALGDLARLVDLLYSLKTFSMYDRLKIEDVNARSFMDNLLTLVRPDCEERGIRLDIARDEVWVSADRRALQQVLLNLVTNSIDALEGIKDPVIAVRWARVENGIQIAVTDNGIGMSKKQLDDLFKPFYTNKAGGTGLGLVIVRKMLTKMNGTIDVASKEGGGTTCRLVLPRGSGDAD